MENDKNTDIRPPLWMPPHSVRAILVIIMLLAYVVGCFQTKNFERLYELLLVGVGWYFGSRPNNNVKI
ncbi:MAG: hypothetical protein D4S01_05705 [Dehalococcoidia bacterium]|nr:MAG: hypothetical protein D4S01_05705 [Dehalococcoidia bacterium]